jgi:hypothetical protein
MHTQTESNETIEMKWEKLKKFDWSHHIVRQLDESREELDERNPVFKFFERGEDEIFIGKDENMADSQGFVSIGETGVSEEWEYFKKNCSKKGVYVK